MKKTSDDCAPGEKAAVPPESSRTARSCVPVPKIEEDCYDWWARHEEKCRTACSFRAEVVFLGDSLTHFWSGESGPDYGEGLWNELYGDLPVLNLGFGFDRTQNVLWRMAHGELEKQSPSLFVVNIGTNQFSITPAYSGDTPEEAARGIVCVAEELHRRAPDALVLLMALFPRGNKVSEIRETNRILRAALPAMPFAEWVDLGGIFGDENGCPREWFYQADLCHLKRAGYQVWGNAIAPWIARSVSRKSGIGQERDGWRSFSAGV